MPDHAHLLVTVGLASVCSLQRWVAWWKRDVALSCQEVAWQKNFWDRTIRSERDFIEVQEYMKNNPVRKGLCARVDEWALQGEIYQLTW